jgi:glycerate 2-kinase
MTLASDARAIALAGIRAVDPAEVVRRHLARSAAGFRLGRARFGARPGGQVRVVAVGKAAGRMADAAVRLLGGNVVGLALPPRGYPGAGPRVRTVFGDHPVPGPRSFRAGAELLRYVQETAPGDVVLFLISGGGSATVEAPAEPLDPQEIADTTRVLLASGAPIGAMNAIRRHLSRVKGGRTAEALRAQRFATLAISDVVGDRPPDIASGPTVPDPSTFREALAAVDRYRLAGALPRAVLAHLRNGVGRPTLETPKPGSARFRGAPFVLGGSNRVALAAAARAARRRGYRVRVSVRPVTGETALAGRAFGRHVARAVGRSAARALLSGGETTVTLGPSAGRGGRNQEFVLAAAGAVAGRSAVVLSVGTDGIDGPTDAAGGWVDGATVARARARRVDLEAALTRHASYRALERLGSLWRTGPTGTNVMDLHIGLTRPSPAGRSPPGRAR